MTNFVFIHGPTNSGSYINLDRVRRIDVMSDFVGRGSMQHWKHTVTVWYLDESSQEFVVVDSWMDKLSQQLIAMDYLE